MQNKFEERRNYSKNTIINMGILLIKFIIFLAQKYIHMDKKIYVGLS